MKALAFTLTLLSAAPLSALAYEPDVTQERMEYDGRDPQDHLVPAGSRRPDEHPVYFLAKFGRYPSFSEAFEWTIVLDKGKYKLESWRLEASEKEVDRPKRVALVSVEITPQLATAIYALWANAILDARYSRGGLGLDGTTYAFSTWLRGVGWPSATTWSPDRDLPPKWMVEAGEEILAYGRAKTRDAPKLLSKLQAIGDRWRAYQQRPTVNWPNTSLERTRER